MAKSRINLLAFPSNALDAPSFYRCMGPLAALRQQKPGLQVSVIQEVNWASMALADVVFLQRPHSDVQRQIAQMAAKHGVPIWVDHDDDVFDIPKGNPAYNQYMNPGTSANIAAILRMADHVTASTPALAEKLGRIATNVTVVPNALMTNIAGTLPNHDGQPRVGMVYWRGGGTHQRDLDTYTQQMIDVAARHPEIPWAFQGITEANYSLVDGIAGAQALKPTDPLDYMHSIAKLRPKVVVVPLHDNAFNRSKSNIAWIEGTFAGAVVVGPDWPEWQRPGVLNYTPDTFGDVLARAITMTDDEQNAQWRLSASYINEHLGVYDVNRKRERVVDACAQMRMDHAWRAQKRFSVVA
jgi:hypothetical protein